ncbi:entericidin A/B family lipoprotein [Thioalkalivibrio paradoxus]|uniref:Entericidin EcnAB n=1 Tax=Thioalkalivibrio paradoxus ARh 1 TaxID=713585 RepID=W0DR03_9GAMM|nr:entericidin A/B family lipoprotein [Thioalkalivibrio paradoxus]AHE99428.1 entericidin EcnAB [Thioalkalivibrio paradoxus ARh 1]
MMSWAVLLAGLAVFTVAGLGGCGTVEGFGKDVQKGGEAIERAAERRKPD